MIKKTRAFSLLEMSIVLLIIGIIIAGITLSTRLVRESRLKTARNLTESSNVASIEGLILWMDSTAKDVFTNSSNSVKIDDGQTIKTWKDINPSNKKFTFTEISSGAGPIYKVNGINNLPTAYFNGSASCEGAGNGDCLYTAFSPTLNPPQYTIFIVTKPIVQNNANTYPAVYSSLLNSGSNYSSGGAWTGGFLLYKTTNAANTNVMQFYTGNGKQLSGWNNVDGPNSPINKTYIITTKLSGVTTSDYRYIYQNGILKASSTSAASVPNDGGNPDNNSSFNLGCYSSSSRFYNGYISEFIMFDRALNDEDRQAVERYLSQKYAIPLGG